MHAPAKLPALVDVARTWEPDVILFDSCDLAGPIAAAALGVPAVNHSFGVMLPLAALEAAREHVDPLWRGQGLEPLVYVTMATCTSPSSSGRCSTVWGRRRATAPRS